MIVLIRHGETAGNAQRIVQTEDTELNARGLAQAEELGRRIASHDVALVLCSDLVRARMTAEPLLRATGAQVLYTPLLRERNFGDLRGRPYAELGFDLFDPALVPPNGETESIFHARVDEAWQLIQTHAAATDRDLVVLTHGLVCGAIAGRHLRTREGEEVPPRWGNTSVTICEARHPFRITLLNCTAHLAGGVDDAAGARV